MLPDAIRPHVETIVQRIKPHQKVAVCFYIGTVVVSFLYSILARAPVSYFSYKRNLFNVLFVKLGWFWTSIVFWFYLSQQPQQKQMQGLARYAFVTLYWYLLTQWLLGPSFIDRVFVATGGHCTHVETQLSIQSVYHQAACRAAGGKWGGGHDVSGHCVLLIHASLFLWEEIAFSFYSLPAVKRLSGLRRRAFQAVGALMVLWWWMLVMTSVYFHGHFELISGCFFGVLGWAILYLGVFPQLPSVGLPSLVLE
ncbi:inositol phospholipid synthesis and fat-storage-inducing TM-domain-containing protein [Syncephalastrum racemosum]|uniref:Inositol phospholipid synthesis and fat-storage-inducing TM-domain-containing protein n=1 Tax=Syncephalastrum racemosum TaxID=13706 RepID=A0A1X2H3K7_SYNRA|nr:inositol phospholipid synthesis and fat-storage-inducing TM-domain-containing protein [Syncephalastrum racemosum]